MIHAVWLLIWMIIGMYLAARRGAKTAILVLLLSFMFAMGLQGFEHALPSIIPPGIHESVAGILLGLLFGVTIDIVGSFVKKLFLKQ